jgi:uncharacterized protein
MTTPARPTARDSDKLEELREAILANCVGLGGHLQAAYLYGSYASPTMRPDSDLDLALLCDCRLGLKTRLDLAAQLSTALAIEAVDLVDLRAVNSVFAAQVINTGTRIITTDKRAVDEFEMLSYANYARLNEERAGILADIRQRGSVFPVLTA